MADSKHPRLILHNFLSLDLCKELEFIHKSCGTVGYRPNVFSTTLSHLIATNCAHLIMPIIPIRERLREKAEEYFGCQYELFVEFTGLISWCRGASIGWHSDDNRPYLKQRDFAAVCYLNSYEADFKGGIFHFKDGEPADIVPVAGDVIMYTADDQNIHSVDEITEGERITLTLWFSRDASYDEDPKVISSLSPALSGVVDSKLRSYLPLPGSINMYWFPPDEASSFLSGFDIRCGRLHVVGFDIYPFQETCDLSASDSSYNLLELLSEPLLLARESQLFETQFLNIMHALQQMVQFYLWKFSNLKTKVEETTPQVIPTSQKQKTEIDRLKSVFLKDIQLGERFFGHSRPIKDKVYEFDWVTFSAAVPEWECYVFKLQRELLLHLPHWRTNQSIFCVPLGDLED
ncbi:uncharacterized protein LOC132032890 isoform X1 [Lycium ferocissimum]|uniref:uncharacterized protein LOC132032890 isoform X1 n=1 Tax=Lycium ferocissimum TaxID=112874 RepID=UPI002814A45A|nr:uncharacterized protein LOC132032890 isoform X1 [Lycium ferocissimum]